MNPPNICYGDKVELTDSQRGIVSYIGMVKNKNCVYYGINLQSKTGSHNGTVNGRKYFDCAHKHGIFVKLKDITSVIKKSSLTQTRYSYNQRIYIKNKAKIGYIKYIGLCANLDINSNNSDPLWFGVEIDTKNSKNKYYSNGTIEKIVYFKCSKNRSALFIQKSNIALPPKKSKKSKKKSKPKTPNSTPKSKRPKTNSKSTKTSKKSDINRRNSVLDLFKNKMPNNKTRSSRSLSTIKSPKSPTKSPKKRRKRSTRAKPKPINVQKMDKKSPQRNRSHSVEFRKRNSKKRAFTFSKASASQTPDTNTKPKKKKRKRKKKTESMMNVMKQLPFSITPTTDETEMDIKPEIEIEIKEIMSESSGSDSDEDCDSLSLFVTAWNVSESDVSDQAVLRKWLSESGRYDLYVIGLQECVGQHRKAWVNGILSHIDGDTNQYVLLQKLHLMNIMCIVIVNRLYVTRISGVKCKTIACGKGNIIGNKGACVVSMKFDETSFAFINVHLVAREERAMQRMENIERIFKNIHSSNMGHISDKMDINQFNHCIFFGDLNYRIVKDFWKVCDMIRDGKYSHFVKYDQLNEQMRIHNILYGFKEGNLSLFAPTYRWKKDKNVISNKREQPPSYTDRILYKSLENCSLFWQTKYRSCMDCFGSDHRPIVSVFKFVPRNLPRHMRKHKKFKTINIYLDGLKLFLNQKSAEQSGQSGNVCMFDPNNCDKNDKICMNLYYNYSNNQNKDFPQIIMKNGTFNSKQECWLWDSLTIPQMRIVPYILNPQFLCLTHIYIQIINASKSNQIVGYANVSLFNGFSNDELSAGMINKMKSNYNKSEKSVKKNRFNSAITMHGRYIGNIKGSIHVKSELAERHSKISTYSTKK